LAGVVIGYTPDAHLGRGWSLFLTTLFVAAVAAVGTATVRLTHGDPPATREHIQVLARLDDYTRNAGPNARNTIPSFLALRGAVGALRSDAAPTETVKSIGEADIRQGFCSRSVARQVRFEYPGYYERWSDARLERAVVQKYPEYRDRVCVLPVRIDAAAADIVKYELKPRSFINRAGLWLMTLLVTAVFALACLNVYFRLVIARLAVRA
jgi:hypothetical protein